MLDGTPEITFVIGGPYGLSRAVKEKANLKMALSPMTLTHQMARLILLEQIYRGMTILRNEPYHNR
jgi:23S rRNA (pseudouridine1915-N3)-methyltransferase